MTPDTVGGRVGLVNVGDGVGAVIRLGKQADVIVSQLMGELYEAASRSKLFIASNAVAGVAPGTALGTTPPMTIHNPASSGILVAIREVVVSYVSGTLGAGTIAHAFCAQAAAPTTGTELTPQGMPLGGAAGQAKAYTGSTVAATPTILRPAFNMGAALASSAEFAKEAAKDKVNGGIVIPAGYAYCLQGIAAGGSTPLVILAVVYQEITIP